MYLVLGRENCSYCEAAINALIKADKEFTYFDVTDKENDRLREILTVDLGHNKVPQIFELVGGYDELKHKLYDEDNKDRL
jgi:glutaredoxin